MFSNEIARQFPGRVFIHSDLRIMILSKAQAEQLNLVLPHMVVSIESPYMPAPHMPKNPNRLGHLYLGIDDYDYPHRKHFTDDQLVVDGHPPRWCNEEHAIKVKVFLEKYLNASKFLIVHCNAGLSRSPAIAAAILEWLGSSSQEVKESFSGYNKLVYDAMRVGLWRETLSGFSF